MAILNSIIGASQLLYPQLGSGIKRLGVCGDSITANGTTTTATYQSFLAPGYAAWLGVLSNQKLKVNAGDYFALSGITTRRFIDEGYLASALAAKDNVSAYSVLLGTNDIQNINGTTITMASIKSDYIQLVNYLKSTNKPIILIVPIPRDSLSATGLKRHADFSRFIHNLCRDDTNLILCDVTQQLINTTTTADNSASGMLSDGIHPTATGAYFIAKRMLAILDKYIPDTTPYGVSRNGDLYDATENPYGNLTSYGLMVGTSGTKTGAVTGNIADGFNCTLTANGTLSVAGSIVARTDVVAGNWQQLDFSGAQSTSGSVTYKIATAITGYNTGDYLELTADFELPSGHTGITSFAMILNDINTPFVAYCLPNFTNTPVYQSTELTKGTFRTPILPCVATTTSITAYLSIAFAATPAISGTVKIGNVCVRKIPATDL